MNKRQKKKFIKKCEYKKYGIITKIYSAVIPDGTLDIVSVEYDNGSGKVCKAERFINCYPISMDSVPERNSEHELFIEFKCTPYSNSTVEEAWSSLLSLFTADTGPEPMYGNITEDNFVTPSCSVCIYRSNCPCGYSRGNAACLTIFKSINS